MHQLDNMEIDYDIDIPIVVENTFSVLKHHSYIRGYHAYMNIWTPIIGDDNLLCKHERDNKHDENAIAVLKGNGSGPRIGGHVPFCYSSLFMKFFSLPYHCIKVCVEGKRVNRGVGYGLEIPAEYTFVGNEKVVEWLKKAIAKVDRNMEEKVSKCLK